MTKNNSNRIGASVEPETKSLAEIIDSFLNGFKKLWWIAVIATVLCGVLGYLHYKRSYVPVYQSEVTFSIVASEYDGTDQSYTNNSQLASILSVSFDYLINNEVFYEIVEEDIGVDYMPSTITISAIADTNILSIMATGNDADMNLKVIHSVMENYSSVAEVVLGDLKDTQLKILEPPTGGTLTNPYQPASAVIKFGLIGLIIGLIPSVLYALFIRTIKSKDDVEKYLSVTCFGVLPAVFLNKKDKEDSECSILNKDVGFRYLEAMRIITSRCERTLKKSNCKVILVTSTQEGEGKSTFAMNLAYSLSKTQNKVMLIDGDLRNPSLRKLTHAELPEYDMDKFIHREIKSSEAVVNLPSTRVLLLAPDTASKNPVQCLNSDEMEQFIENGRDVVDYIIIDAPACGGVSDAAVLAKYSDGIIYVVKEDSARVNKILDTIQEFSYTRTPIVGCVLNGSLGKLKLSHGYGYGKHYGYGKYGYGKYGYGKYGYGGYGYGGYGYGEYGEVSEEEFRTKPRKVSNHISMKTTEEQKKALEQERLAEQEKDKEQNKKPD